MKVGENITLTSFLLCEEVRREMSNKAIILGVFAGDILISKVPGTIPVALYGEGFVNGPGDHDLWIKFSGPGSGSFKLKVVMQAGNEGNSIVIFTPRFEILMECEGVFKISLSRDGKRWKTAVSKKVSVSDSIPGAIPILPELRDEQ